MCERILTKRWDGIDKGEADEMFKIILRTIVKWSGRTEEIFSSIEEDASDTVKATDPVVREFPKNIIKYHWVYEGTNEGHWRCLVELEGGYYALLKIHWTVGGFLKLKNMNLYISKRWGSIILYCMSEQDYLLYIDETVEDYPKEEKEEEKKSSEKVDFEVLLMKYIGLVGQREGCSFIRKEKDEHLFTSREWNALQKCVENSMKLKEILEFREKVE